MARKRKIPLRKCVVTNEMKPKKELIRVVRNKEGDVFVDTSGKKNGRGAYLSKDKHIIEMAKKSAVLSKHLNAKVDSSVYEELNRLIDGNPNEK